MDNCENIRREQEKLIATLAAQWGQVREQLLSPRINLAALEAEITVMKVRFESQKQQMYQNQAYLQKCENHSGDISDQSKNQLAMEAYGRSANPECIPREPSEYVRENFEMSAAPKRFTFAGKIVPKEYWKHYTQHEDVLNNCSIQISIRCETGQTYDVTATPCSKVKVEGIEKFNKQMIVEFGGHTRQNWTLHGQFWIWTQPKRGGVLKFGYSAMLKRKPFVKGNPNQIWITGKITGDQAKAYDGKCTIHREPQSAKFPNEIIHYDVESSGSEWAAPAGDGSAEMWFTPQYGTADPKCKKY